ncbi:unnamed protein product [Rotaria sp. Silwood2]|nr:unnamed protein product [Rotaria sp. Silwood2]CAF3399969.1 unnamed protein product [Rotaria sp. Silwood2]CAF4364723.1 unnamed protein product [Rotaria sp. Silwood2]CAF4582634.1 unnamed protein product [Rotaria sp. Silwood2]
MTTQVKSIFNLSRLQSILDQLTTYTIVCFGIFQIDENHIKVVKKLQQRFTKIKKFEDYKLCEEYIKTNLSNLNDLIKKLTKDQQILLRKDETSRPNIYNRSKRDFFLIYEQRNAEFLYFQLFLGSLMKMSYDDIRAKQKLIDPWRIHCSNNTEQEKNNCNFETSYNPMQDVYWYSTEMFFYSILNKAFRDQNIDTLFAMRYFILNLTHQLADQHCKFLQKSNKKQLTSYRDQKIFMDELELIHNSHDQFICSNSFLSISADKEVALAFVDIIPTATSIPILFEITIDTNMKTVPFA